MPGGREEIPQAREPRLGRRGCQEARRGMRKVSWLVRQQAATLGLRHERRGPWANCQCDFGRQTAKSASIKLTIDAIAPRRAGAREMRAPAAGSNDLGALSPCEHLLALSRLVVAELKSVVSKRAGIRTSCKRVPREFRLGRLCRGLAAQICRERRRLRPACNQRGHLNHVYTTSWLPGEAFTQTGRRLGDFDLSGSPSSGRKQPLLI